MPVRLIPSEWAAATSYAQDDVVQYNGIRFIAAAAITGAATNANPIDNEAQWTFDSVLRITDYYSLQYAVQEAINTTSTTINNSIPSYIENVERYLSKSLRSPAQKERRVFTVDADSKFSIPSDMLEVSHLRRNTDDSSYDLRSRGSISVVRAPDRESWETLSQYYANTGPFWRDQSTYSYPYWIADNEFIWIAPEYDSGTEFELEYYQSVPRLGTTGGRVNDDYVALDSQGRTRAEAVAAGDGFTQQQITVTTNLWTATQPNLLKAGACVEAFRFLKEDRDAALWQAEYDAQLQAAMDEFAAFEAGGPQGLQQETPYC